MRFFAVASLALLAALPAAWPVHAQPATPELRVGGELADMLQAEVHGNRAEIQRLGRHGRAVWHGDLLQVQLHLAPGVDAESLTDGQLAAFGARTGDRGIDVLDVWLPMARLPALLQGLPQVAFARLPDRAWPMTGPVTSQGATALRTSQVTCLADDATGVTVAVVDEGFSDLDKSVASGETPHVLGAYDATGGAHGSMCVEVVADVAPGVGIVAVRTETLSALQKLAKEIKTKGNPRHIDVLSHSVGWFGMSFGRHDGSICAVTDMVRSAGVAWVNASGNYGGGLFYTGAYLDADKDGLQDFQPGEPRLTFRQYGGSIAAIVDWDDYTKRTQDFDVVLQKLDGEKWVDVDKSSNKQGKYTPPVEQVRIESAPPGIYALQVVCKSGCKAGTRMRIVNLGGGSGTFSISHRNGDVYDPASCKGVLAVGALHHSHYTQPPLETYSSYGPTVDGRQKPEVVAPTGVATSFGAFYGTSAACPHAAGAVALYVAKGYKPLEAMQKVIDDAAQMGTGHPDEAYGWGRVDVRGKSLGWQCQSAQGMPGEVTLSADSTCTTTCGSVGMQACQTGCRWSACSPPDETCNGLDDDCDGSQDNDFACALGSTATCTTSCGGVGNRSCGKGCSWGACSGCEVDAGSLDGQGADAGSVKISIGHEPTWSGCSARPVGQGWPWWCALLGVVLVRRRRAMS